MQYTYTFTKNLFNILSLIKTYYINNINIIHNINTKICQLFSKNKDNKNKLKTLNH